jgi:hypothetical protein
MKVGHQGTAVAGLPGLSGGAPMASALPPNVPMPPVPVGGAPTGPSGVRPQPIDSGIDGWFLDRLFGRR